MKSSLTLKLIAAFAAVCIIEALLVAFLMREATQRSFDEFLRAEAIEVFEEDVRRFYERTGTLEGVQRELGRNRGPVQSPRRIGEPPPIRNGQRRPPVSKNPQFGLTNTEGMVIVSNGEFKVGDQAPSEVFGNGLPFVVDGEKLGLILMPSGRMALSERESKYLQRLDGALLAASVGVVFFAVVLGVWLARGYTRPIKELTKASRALADGELGTQVAVTSSDEVGELSESFNRMSAQLNEVSAQRRRMTADIAHDLRTPLTVLSGYLEALWNEELKPTPERFEMLHQEATHLSRLVDDLRVLALADSGELSLNRSHVEIESLLQRVARSFQDQAGKAGVAIHVDSKGLSTPVSLDADRMIQVLTNLVGNALRYTPDGGEITLSVFGEKDHVVIEVQDTGSGISSDDIPHLFNRFYRADESRQRDQGESGLGLAIVKSLVEVHDGTVSVSSQEGKGSRFCITLPRA